MFMRGTIQNQVDRETRFTNEFDQFVAEPGELLVSVYNRFAHLMNDLERNNMKFPTVSFKTKFLNSLQSECLKYVTQVCLAKRLTVDSFDDLFDYLLQFEKLVNASRAKKLEKSHDPLALVAHTGSSSRNTSSYYVTHPSSVVDYDEQAKKEAVYVRKNKQTDNTFAKVVSNKENVIDVAVANASKAKTLLWCFLYARIPKSSETTFVAPKTRFSEKCDKQLRTLDTTSVSSKSKIDEAMHQKLE
ncbi:hypothetical protein Tco_0104776 [Tanacetum coccineum]